MGRADLRLEAPNLEEQGQGEHADMGQIRSTTQRAPFDDQVSVERNCELEAKATTRPACAKSEYANKEAK